jgi:hypothetical protein
MDRKYQQFRVDADGCTERHEELRPLTQPMNDPNHILIEHLPRLALFSTQE